jgi:hypothetical protein
MFNYLKETVERVAREQGKNMGHKWNHDFKTAMGSNLANILTEYGNRVSWAVDRKTELKNIDEYRKLKNDKGHGYNYGEQEAVIAGYEAAKAVSLNKQTGIDAKRYIGA